MPYTPAWQHPEWTQAGAGNPPGTTPPAPGTPPAAGANSATPPVPPTQMPGFQPGQGATPGQMQPWSSWMTAGGANPAGWQSLGGGPDLGFLQNFQNLMNGGANPTSVNATSANQMFGNTQPYVDSSYQQATRQLDPQVAAQNAQFEQQMVNQGIAPGSAAYDQAKSQMGMQQSDQYAQARAAAQQQGLAAQGQAFGQGLSQSQLANTLAGQLLGAQTGIANQQLGGNASIMNQLLGGNSGIAQQIIGGNAQMGSAASSAGASRYAAGLNNQLGMAQLGQQGQQQDFSNLMQLLGMGSGMTQYNNGLQQQQFGNANQMLGYIPQGGGGQIDVTGPYNSQYNGQMANYGIDQQNANSTNQAAMSAAMMMMMLCDRNAKERIGEFAVSGTEIVRQLPVDVWRYKGENDPHVGTYAQDFNKAAGLPENTHIKIVDMLGVLLKATQELIAKTERIESRLSVAGVA